MTGCCRDCNIVYKHCHNPEYSCKFLKSSLFKGLSSKIQKALSFIPVKINAFSDICFGNDVHGLVGSCPPKPLHQWYPLFSTKVDFSLAFPVLSKVQNRSIWVQIEG